MTSSTRHPAKTEPGPSSAASPPVSGGGCRHRGRACRGPRLPGRCRGGCRGRGGPCRGGRGGLAGAGERARAAAGERRPGRGRSAGLGHLHGGRADPHRVARLQRLALAHGLAVHERPVGRSEILDRQLAACVAGNAGVAAGKLVIVVQPPLSAHCPPDDELVLEREPATRGRAGGDHQLLGGHGHGARGVGHLQDRLAHLHHVAHVERPRSVDALAVHERPVRGPEVLDREEAVGPARDPRVAAGDLAIAAEPSVLMGGFAADEQVGVHAQALAALVALSDPKLLARHQHRTLEPPLPVRGKGTRLKLLSCARVPTAARKRPRARDSARPAGWRSPPRRRRARRSGRS